YNIFGYNYQKYFTANIIKNNEIIYQNPKYKRKYHTGILYKNNVYIFGGYNIGIDLNDLLIYNLDTNTIKRYETNLKSRSWHNAVLYKNEMYIFGGFNTTEGYLNDFWKLNLDTLKWTEIKALNQHPESRCNFNIHCKGNKIYLFAGYNRHKSFKDFNIYDIKLNKWEKIYDDSSYIFNQSASILIDNEIYDVFGCENNCLFKIMI